MLSNNWLHLLVKMRDEKILAETPRLQGLQKSFEPSWKLRERMDPKPDWGNQTMATILYHQNVSPV